MTTLAVDTARVYQLGEIEAYGVIAADIIYEGAAVGDNGAGYARPLSGGDKFIGFAEQQADNSAGLAAARDVRAITSGRVQLSVSGAVITDVGQPVYATDDDTFVFLPTGGSFIGRVTRFVSSGVVIVGFDVHGLSDPFPGVRETIIDNKTLDAEDTGKTFFVTVDAKTITLPATATASLGIKIVNGGAFGAVAVNISPNANDLIYGPDIGGTDNKDLINTKATAQRGDYAVVSAGHANGWTVSELVGTWAEEA